MILRDDNGTEWNCTELDHWAGGRDTGGKDYRLLRCTRVNHPEATPRYVSVPLGFDLTDPSVQRQLLSRPYQRE